MHEWGYSTWDCIGTDISSMQIDLHFCTPSTAKGAPGGCIACSRRGEDRRTGGGSHVTWPPPNLAVEGRALSPRTTRSALAPSPGRCRYISARHVNGIVIFNTGLLQVWAGAKSLGKVWAWGVSMWRPSNAPKRDYTCPKDLPRGKSGVWRRAGGCRETRHSCSGCCVPLILLSQRGIK